MSDIAINVENLSKQYRLGKIGTGSFSHDVNRWWYKVRGKEDPYLKVGEANDRSQKGDSEYVWSLKDINFNINRGEVVGIIGRNGAGKSTLLKILSRTTAPTTGIVKIKGRVASLLEVGTGFHPELTGKENIYLNGAILGMKKKEIARKFDQIVDFSGVERYIDTPVKRYSSGMYVRLAFAVAAHLESEILIVDEVLAVGDAEFQRKCLGKMGEVSQGEGRTVLFVSHNMSAIRSLCQSSVVLSKGTIDYIGNVHSGITAYANPKEKEQVDNSFENTMDIPENLPLTLRSARMSNVAGILTSNFECDEDIYIHIKVEVTRPGGTLKGYLAIRNASEEVFIESDTNDFLPSVFSTVGKGMHSFVLKINKRILPIGDFFVYMNFSNDIERQFGIGPARDILKFSISDSNTVRGNTRKSFTSAIINWEISQ